MTMLGPAREDDPRLAAVGQDCSIASLIPSHRQTATIVAHGSQQHSDRTGGQTPPLPLLHGVADYGLCRLPVARSMEHGHGQHLAFDQAGHVISRNAFAPYVEIEGEYYWDGGYMGNPPLFPLCYHTESQDVIVVHINPIVRDQVPTTASEIMNRLNEISFNSSLLREFRAIAFVTKLIEEDWLKEEYRGRLKQVFIHSIRADNALADAGAASKFTLDWPFLTALRDKGRATATAWLEQHVASLNQRSTVDLSAEFLDSHTLFWENEHVSHLEQQYAVELAA